MFFEGKRGEGALMDMVSWIWMQISAVSELASGVRTKVAYLAQSLPAPLVPPFVANQGNMIAWFLLS